MALRPQLVPWRTAGRVSEAQRSADDVVREIGWVFNNETGHSLDIEEFTRTGDNEIEAYLRAFDLWSDQQAEHTLVEIGSGIGRMTCGFSRFFGEVIACDLDPAFLERCRQTVAQLGLVEHLRTCRVEDGRTLNIPDASADLVFSYITLQHCQHDDALSLVGEAARVVRPGGHIALNFRTWTAVDIILWPMGKLTRALWRLPGIGPWVARRRLLSRFGWQANRLSPEQVDKHLQRVGVPLTNRVIYQSPKRRVRDRGETAVRSFEGVHRSHWWLIAERA